MSISGQCLAPIQTSKNERVVRGQVDDSTGSSSCSKVPAEGEMWTTNSKAK